MMFFRKVFDLQKHLKVIHCLKNLLDKIKIIKWKVDFIALHKRCYMICKIRIGVRSCFFFFVKTDNFSKLFPPTLNDERN